MQSIFKPNIIDKYFYIWAALLPITSFLLVPFIQGTTPGYILSFLALAFVPLIAKKPQGFIRDLIIFLYGFLLVTFCSQLAIGLTPNTHFENIITVSNGNEELFRKSFFTQSLYLMAAISLFLYVKHFYKPKWDRFFITGAVLLAAYGLYEVVYFFLFHTNGDFISNRMFGDHSGSVFQTMRIGTLQLIRLTSLTGEPSMYALTIIPYWIYSLHKNKHITQLFLLATLLLSTSTSALLGIFVYMSLRLYYFRLKDKIFWMLLPLCVLVFVIYNKIIIMSFNKLVWDKLTMDSLSGTQRSQYFLEHFNYFLNDMNIINKFFGMGFGTVRSTDFFTTLLVNAGIIGVITFTILFFYPIFKLKNTYENVGIKSILICIYIIMMVSIPEFGYLPTWLFLGIAYNKCKEQLLITIDT